MSLSTTCLSQAAQGGFTYTGLLAQRNHVSIELSFMGTDERRCCRVQGHSPADLAMAALQAALPAPEAPADARRSLLAHSCPAPAMHAPGSGRPAGLCSHGGGASPPLLGTEQAAAEGPHPGLPPLRAVAAGDAGSSPFAEPGARGAVHAGGCSRDGQQGLGPGLLSGPAPAVPGRPHVQLAWQRLQVVLTSLASLGACMPPSCEVCACSAAALHTYYFFSLLGW